MITIVDYGLGNIGAFVNVYKRLNIDVKVARENNQLTDASKIILPGVGSFDYAMSQLNKSGMRQELEKLVLEERIPVLGICVGMQMLANKSDEGKMSGLGWIDGHVRLFRRDSLPLNAPLPHMGWNNVMMVRTDSGITKGFDNESRFYFLHSYYFDCSCAEDIVCETNYGGNFTSMVNKENIYGVQFHPEKSHQSGVRLLYNFATL